MDELFNDIEILELPMPLADIMADAPPTGVAVEEAPAVIEVSQPVEDSPLVAQSDQEETTSNRIEPSQVCLGSGPFNRKGYYSTGHYRTYFSKLRV